MINRLKYCNQIVLLVLYVSLFLTSSYAQKRNFKNGKVKTIDYFQEIPFEFQKNKIIIPVEIEGKTYRFLLDTGAPNIISKEIYEVLQPKQASTLLASDANEISQKIDVVTLKSLNIGTVEFYNFSALVFDLNGSEVFKCFGIDGFIGSNLLRHSIIQIDAKQKVLKLTDRVKQLRLDKKQSQKIKFPDNQFSPYISTDLQGKDNGREMVLIDTGMGRLYDISEDNYDIFKTKKIFNAIGNSDGASSISLFGEVPIDNQTRVHLPKMVINDFEINNIITHTTKGDHSKIGAELLNYGIMTIDYKNKRFYFDSYEESLDLEGGFGFTQTLKDNKLVVGYVWDEDLKTKITYGDQIIEVNGIEITADKFCDFVIKTSILKSSKSFDLKIKIADNSVIDLKVKKKPLSLILDNYN